MLAFLFGSQSWRIIGLKLVFTFVVALLGYLIYLDSKMQTVFSELTQSQSIEIRAMNQVIRTGILLPKSEVTAQLKALNYKKVATISQPKQYAESANKLAIFLDDQAQVAGLPTQQVWVEFEAQRVVAIQTAKGQAVSAFQLPGVVLDKIWAGDREDRVRVALADVPEQLINILLWVEDRDFYQHWGLNPWSIGRALFANWSAGKTVQGGSTLTQQLAKNLLLTRERSLTRKVNEALLSLLMEWHYSKQQILEAYINEVYLGQNGATAVHGFATASQFYYGVSLQQLSLQQQVSLVAMVKGPSLYNPWRRPETLQTRRDLLLGMLLQQKVIKQSQYLQASQSKLGVLAQGKLHQTQRPALTSLVKEELALRAPLQKMAPLVAIQTSIDPVSQWSMEQAVSRAIPELERVYQVSQLQVAMLAVDVDSGAVRALVSDRTPDYPGFNRVKHANRPIGSLLKPFILLSALQHRTEMTLASQLHDRPVSMANQHGERWQPQNFDHQYRGSVAAIDALKQSLNVPFVNLGMVVGLEQIQADLAALSERTLPTLYPSDLLGSMSMTPWQVAQIYNTLVEQGVYQPLHLLEAIETDAQAIRLNPLQREQRIDPSLSYQLLFAMQQVVADGTAKRLSLAFPSAAIAGKTGTTNDYRDAWFVGVDGRELVVVWVGRDDNEPIAMTGSKAAMQVYLRYQEQRAPLPLALAPPSDIVMAHFDAKGKAVDENCAFIYQVPVEKLKLNGNMTCVKKMTNLPAVQRPWWKKALDL